MADSERFSFSYVHHDWSKLSELRKVFDLIERTQQKTKTFVTLKTLSWGSFVQLSFVILDKDLRKSSIDRSKWQRKSFVKLNWLALVVEKLSSADFSYNPDVWVQEKWSSRCNERVKIVQLRWDDEEREWMTKVLLSHRFRIEKASFSFVGMTKAEN